MISDPDSPREIKRQDAYERAYEKLCDENTDDPDYEPTPDEIDEEMASMAGDDCDRAYDSWKDEQLMRKHGHEY